MCLGSKPQAPEIKMEGPSASQIASQRAATELYQSQMQAQQDMLSQQLQQQIDVANNQTVALQQKYEAEAAAAAADAARSGADYAVTASQTATPPTARTTAAVAPKQKPSGSLRITTAGGPARAGTGLNIGL